MTQLFPHVPPEQMTSRARLYLLATALYCLTMGLALIFWDNRFTSASIKFVADMVPFHLVGWGIAHLVVAALAGWATWRGSEKAAWRALMGATVMVGPWAAGFWWAFLTKRNISPAGLAVYTFMTAIHLIQARQPLRSPFDPVLRAIVVD
jgi:hypothetical protein